MLFSHCFFWLKHWRFTSNNSRVYCILKVSFIIYADTELLSEKIWGAAYNMYNLRYNIPKVISVVVHNISKYDYHFIIKELPEKLKGQFEGLVKNTEKSIKFYTTIQKWNKYDMVTTTTKKLLIVYDLWLVLR